MLLRVNLMRYSLLMDELIAANWCAQDKRTEREQSVTSRPPSARYDIVLELSSMA